MTTTYCAATDVQRILASSAFSVSTTPTSTQVESTINRFEDFVDDYTGHAWRTKTVTNEYYDVLYGDKKNGFRVKLNHRNIRSLDTDEGDALEIWNGSSWVDYVTTKTEGRANDFWINYTDGVLFFNERPASFMQSVKFTYRYGDSSVPTPIRDAVALLAAAEILSSDDRSALIDETGDASRSSHQSRIQKWTETAYELLRRYKEVVLIV